MLQEVFEEITETEQNIIPAFVPHFKGYNDSNLWTRQGIIIIWNRRKCFYCLFIEMECILMRFPTYVIGSDLAETVKIENTMISNYNVVAIVDRGSDCECEVRRAGKTRHPDLIW